MFLSQVIIRNNNLDDKLITVTKSLDDSMLEIQLSKNEEIVYLVSEPFQLQRPTVTKGIFQQ